MAADRTKCCGSGMCTLNVPDVFDQDPDEGLVIVLDPEPPQELHHAVEDAVELCPASAIRVARLSA
ncbi:ferredoxin [Catenulispora subtropica]|uniref:ferredoxin n=1 Tax=Catenulispora subtropica TaxID=450798 RepID=UPI003CD07E32